jgi:hypothetical protein
MGESLFGGGTQKTSATGFNDLNNDQRTYTTGSNRNVNTGATRNVTNGGTDPSAWQMPYMMSGLDYGRSLLPSVQQYQGISPEQSAAMGVLSRYAGGSGLRSANSLMSAGRDAMGSFRTAERGASGILSSAMSDPTRSIVSDASVYANNPWTQGMIHSAITPIERQLTEVAVPGLNRGSNATGNMDSSRAAMTEAILRRSAGEDEANVTSDILGRQYDNGLNLAAGVRATNLNAALGAVGALSGIGTSGASMVNAGNNMALTDLNVPVQVGQMYQQDANAGNSIAYNSPWNSLNNYWAAAGKPLGTSVTSDSNQTVNSDSNQTALQDSNVTGRNWGLTSSNGTQQNPGPGIIPGLLGAATGIGSFFAPGAFGAPSIASAIGSFFSDRRLKEDIKRVGTLDNGLPVYSYRYIGSKAVQIGLMADEVEKVHPEAVSEVSGFKTVNYSKATR